MGKQAPAPNNYTGAAEKQAAASGQAVDQQTQANRPNQSNPFGFSNWTQGPDGQWTQQSGFNGPLGGAAGNLGGQAAANFGTPMDWSQFGQLDDGSAAREQAINASYGAARDRLDPQWAEREGKMTSGLANAGLDPNSAAFRNSQQQFGQQRTGAYDTAMRSAIQDGTRAQQATFQQNLMQRQQMIAEALRKRGQPLEEMRGLQGLLGMSPFMGAGQAQVPEYLRAMMGQDSAAMDKWIAENSANADAWGGGMKAAGGAASLLPLLFALCDERAKTNIARLDVEAVPGVPWATWDYLPNHGGARGFGVIAQDLQAVAPQYVREREDGLLTVNYAFLSEMN